MKSILLSIRPELVAKILNGEKTIEVRKKYPQNYVGWVYIYCTKDKKYANLINRGGFLTGMVVARFWCDNVEEIDIYTNRIYETKTLNQLELLEKSCLSHCELFEYLGEDYSKKGGYAIHISKLEIFDKPKELSEFNYWKDKSEYGCWYENKLTKAPQNYCYIEGEE